MGCRRSFSAVHAPILAFALLLLPSAAARGQEREYVFPQGVACINDVVRAFNAIDRHGEPMAARPGVIHDQFQGIATGRANHFQGLARLPESPYFLVTAGDSRDGHRGAGLFVVELGSKPGGRAPWRSNLLLDGSSANAVTPTAPPANDRVISNIGYPDTRYWHAGGIGVLGDLVAVPIEGDGFAEWEGDDASRVVFFSLSDPIRPLKFVTEIRRVPFASPATGNRVQSNKGGVAFLARVEGGRILVGVWSDSDSALEGGGSPPRRLDLYLSRTPNALDFPFRVLPGTIVSTTPDVTLTPSQDLLPQVQSLTAIQECGAGDVYLIGALNRNLLGDALGIGTDLLYLFRLDLRYARHGGELALSHATLRQLGAREMHCEKTPLQLGPYANGYCNFNAGVTVHVNGPNELSVYSVDYFLREDASEMRFQEFPPEREWAGSVADAWVQLYTEPFTRTILGSLVPDPDAGSVLIQGVDHHKRHLRNYGSLQGLIDDVSGGHVELNDRARSVRWTIPQGYQYLLFQHADQQGKMLRLEGTGRQESIPDLATVGFSGIISSSGVPDSFPLVAADKAFVETRISEREKGWVELFQHDQFNGQGRARRLRAELDDGVGAIADYRSVPDGVLVTESRDFDDLARAARYQIPEGTVYRLYFDPGFEGEFLDLVGTGRIEELPSFGGANDRISSSELIADAPCPTCPPGNRPPTFPVYLAPANGARDVPTRDVTLRWEPSVDPDSTEPVTYRVHLSEAEISPPFAFTEETEATVAGPLRPGTDYVWYVEAEDVAGARVEGPHWTFRTTENPSQCPEGPPCPDTPVNHEPRITNRNDAPTRVTESSYYVFVAAATDLDGDPLTWRLTGATNAPGMEIDPVTGEIVWLAEPYDPGLSNVYGVEVEVSDGEATDTAGWTVSVLEDTLPKANLRPEGLTVPATAAAGETLLFDAAITNDGEVDSDPFNVAWLIDGVEVAKGSHLGVAAGDTVADGNSQLVWSAETGTHLVSFVVDVDNHVLESNDGDNRAEATVVVDDGGGDGGSCAEVTLVNPSFEEPVVPYPWQRHDSLPGWVGPVDVHRDLPVADGAQVIDLNQNGPGFIRTSFATTPGAEYRVLFAHGVNQYCTSSARFSADVDGTPVATLDSAVALAESEVTFTAAAAETVLQFTSLTAGCGAATIDHVRVLCSGRRADLVPTEILVDGNPVEGEALLFNSGIDNRGDAPSGLFNVRWLIDGVEVGDGSAGSHASVDARETVYDGNSQLPWTAEGGHHTVTFNVDADDHVAESDETNNQVTLELDVEGPPRIVRREYTPKLVYWGGTYLHRLAVEDPNGPEGLTYSLDAGPPGMTIDGGGTLSWPAPYEERGNVYGVAPRVSDGLFEDSQSYQIQVVDLLGTLNNTVAVGSSVTVRLYLTSEGTGNLEIYALSLTGDDADEEWQIAYDGCSGAVLPPGTSCPLDLRLAPTSRGLKSASLVVEWNDSTRPVFYFGIQGESTEATGAPAGPAAASSTQAGLGFSGPAAAACSGRTGRGKKACGSVTGPR